MFIPSLSWTLIHHTLVKHFSSLPVVSCCIQSLSLSCSDQPLPFPRPPLPLQSSASDPFPIYPSSIFSLPNPSRPISILSISPLSPFSSMQSFPFTFLLFIFPSIHSHLFLSISFYHFPSLSFCVPYHSIPSLPHPESFPSLLSLAIISSIIECYVIPSLPSLPLFFIFSNLFPSLSFVRFYLSRPVPSHSHSSLFQFFFLLPVPFFRGLFCPILSHPALPGPVTCIHALSSNVPSRSQYLSSRPTPLQPSRAAP